MVLGAVEVHLLELRSGEGRLVLLLADVASACRLPIPLQRHEWRLAASVLLEDALLRCLLLLDEHHLAVREVQVLPLVQRHGDTLSQCIWWNLDVALLIVADQLAKVDGNAGLVVPRCAQLRLEAQFVVLYDVRCPVADLASRRLVLRVLCEVESSRRLSAQYGSLVRLIVDVFLMVLLDRHIS